MRKVGKGNMAPKAHIKNAEQRTVNIEMFLVQRSALNVQRFYLS
jgi:hypothetical protein